MAEKGSPDVVKRVLFTTLDALRDYLSDLVIVGGWVPQIYAWKEDIPEIPVRSFDVDAAVARKLPIRGQKKIAQLLEDVGFKKEIIDSDVALPDFGRRNYQVTQFFYRKGKVEIPVEFITPLTGSGEDTSIVVQGDLVVPALRYTDILLANTETVSLTGETLDGRKERFKFKIPTLPAFVLAKGLIFVRRRSIDKKGKDLAYILEILKRPDWRKTVVDGLPKVAANHPAGWYRTFKRQLKSAFATEGSTGPAWVAMQYPDIPPADIRRDSFSTFREFLVEIR